MIVFGLALFGLGLFTHTIYIWAAGVALMLLTGLRYIAKSAQGRSPGRSPGGVGRVGGDPELDAAGVGSGGGFEPTGPRAGVLDQVTRELCQLELMNDSEREQVRSLLAGDFAFAEAVDAAASIHLHVQVDDTAALPHPSIQGMGGLAPRRGVGSVKYLFPHGINMIFSSVPVAADDLIAGAPTSARPFLDHVGIDIQSEDDVHQVLFDALPERADRLGWRWVSQPGPVRCCHTEVAAKHWLYPPVGSAGWARPLEVGFGALIISAPTMGGDLRPMDPGRPHDGSGSGCHADAPMGVSPVACRHATDPAVPASEESDH